MKNILFAIFLFALQTSVSAKCASSGIYPVNAVFDCNSTGIHPTVSNNFSITKNSMIILEFFSSSQSLVTELGKKHLVYLKTGDKRVMLVAKEILKGDFQLTQVVFKPLTALDEGSTYELVISNIKEYERPRIYNRVSNKYEPVTYKIISEPTTSTLQFKNTPTESKKTMCSYGCGPAKWVYYQVNPENSGPLYVRTFLTNKTTGKTTEYLLPLENNTIRIGHGMCSGAFIFEQKVQYEIAFMLVDHTGNNGQKTKPMAIKEPTSFTEAE